MITDLKVRYFFYGMQQCIYVWNQYGVIKGVYTKLTRVFPVFARR